MEHELRPLVLLYIPTGEILKMAETRLAKCVYISKQNSHLPYFKAGRLLAYSDSFEGSRAQIIFLADSVL